MNPSSSLGLISVEMFNQDEHLRSRGLTRQNMDKDGNCLFRAISFGLYHTQDMYAELRSQAIGYIRDHYDAFRDFFIPSSGQSPSDFMQDELHRLEQDGVYAGYECIAALGQLFNIHFEVFPGGHPENPRVTSIHFGQSGQHSIFLIYSSLGGGHYDAGIEIERSVSNPGNNILQPESLVTPNNIDIDYASSVDQLVAEVPFVEHEHLDVNSSKSASAHVKASDDSHSCDCNNVKINISAPKVSSVSINSQKQPGSNTQSQYRNCHSSQHICSTCNLSFSSKSNLNRHLKNKHCSVKDITAQNKERKTDNMCEHCETYFSTKSSLKRHIKTNKCRVKNLRKTNLLNGHELTVTVSNHSYGSNEKLSDNEPSLRSNSTRTGHVNCLNRRCTSTFTKVNFMLNHLKKAHGTLISVSNLNFNSSEQFFTWKENEERNNYVFYRKIRKPQQNKNHKYLQYICNRSGKSKPYKPRQGKGRFGKCNKKGSCKINKVCPARMLVKIYNDDKVNVKYIHTHTHATSVNETKFLPIPNSLKSEIGSKLALGIPEDVILKQIHGKNCSFENREKTKFNKHHFVNKRSVRNIALQQLMLDKNRDLCNATSVDLLVKNYSTKENNPVLLYKPFNSDDEDKILDYSDFILVLMTKYQRQMFEQFAHRIICIDSTHGTNSYGYKLITVLVVDEFKKG